MPLEDQHYQEFTKELQTIQDVLRWSVTQFNKNKLFFGHGTDNAWDEAIVLLTNFLKLSVENLANILDAKLTLNERTELYKALTLRINERVPLPYITHEAWYAGMAFYVDNRVLIPRSPIAELIANNLEPYLTGVTGVTGLEIESNDKLDVLEIGTGSGCIACAVADHFIGQGLDIKVDASDISTDALTVAKLNVENHELQSHITLIQSDLFNNLIGKKYDVIISNPPYVDAPEMQNLPAEFLHEPRSALAAGEDGLDLVDIILKEAHNYLKPNGILIVEVGASRIALENKYPNVAFEWPDFANGGEGVFILTQEQLVNF